MSVSCLYILNTFGLKQGWRRLQLFLRHIVFYLQACQFLDEWGCYAYAEFAGEEFDVPAFFWVVEEHCQWNIAFVLLYEFDQALTEFRSEHRGGYAD